MHALTLDGIVIHQLIFFLYAFLISHHLIFQFGQLRCYIWEHEEIIIIDNRRHKLVSLIGHVHALMLLVNYEEQWVSCFRHTSVVVFHIIFFNLKHTGLDTLFTQILNKRFVFRQSLVCTEQRQESFLNIFFIIAINKFLSISKVLTYEFALCFNQLFYYRAILLKHLYITLWYRS